MWLAKFPSRNDRRDWGAWEFITHELASIYAIGDRAIILDRGSIVAEGSPGELRDHPTDDYVRAFFRREPERARAA